MTLKQYFWPLPLVLAITFILMSGGGIFGQDKPSLLAPEKRKWYLNYEEALELIKSGEYIQAARYLETAISQKPKPSKSTRFYGSIRRSYLPYFYLGVAYLKSGKLEQARYNFDKSKSFGEINDLDESRQLPGYLSEIQQKLAEQRQPSKPRTDPAFEKASALFADGKYAEAKPLLQKIDKDSPFADQAKDMLKRIQAREDLQNEVDRLAHQADQAFSQGRWTDAQQAYQQIYKKKPDYPGLLDKIARVDKAVRLSQELADARAKVATDPAEAEDILDRIRGENPDFPGLGDVARQVTAEKRRREQADRRASLARYLKDGESAFTAGNLEKARRSFNDALNLEPTADQKSRIQDYLGRIDTRLRQRNQIQSLLTQAREAMKRGDPAAARKALGDVLTLDANNSQAREYMTILEKSGGEDSSRMAEKLLKEGLRKYFLGNYPEAVATLKNYLGLSDEHGDLARFFLGAAQVSEFYTTRDSSPQLADNGLQNLLAVKRSGRFTLSDRLKALVSPRIIKVYEEEALDKEKIIW